MASIFKSYSFIPCICCRFVSLKAVSMLKFMKKSELLYRFGCIGYISKIIEIPCVGLALECLVDHWSNPPPLLPTPTRHLSAKSAKSSPALTCTCRRCQKNSRWALALHYQTCSVVHVLNVLQNLSCHNNIRAKSVQSWRQTHVRYLRSRPGPWLPQSADWPLAHHCLF